MLKKIVIPTSIGLATVMIAAALFSLPVNNTENNSTGLVAPSMSVYEITQLEEITATTPNKPNSSVDFGPDDPVTKQDSGVNHEFAKYQNIAKDLDESFKNVKILSNDDNSRTSILLSNSEINSETTDSEFLYKDGGIWITVTEFTDREKPFDVYVQNLNTGFRVVDVNEKYQAALQSHGQVEQFGGVVERQMVLKMSTDTHDITIRGLISDEQAIKIADYLGRS